MQSGPLVTLSPTSLTFASQTVGTVSPPQTIVLTNSGVSTLTITSIVVSGDYGIASTCGVSILAGKQCSIIVSFAPTAAGTRTGTVSVTDNAPGSPQTVSLTGTGIAPSVTLAPTTLTFATQLVSTTSAPQTVTLTNTGTAALTISLISITGANLTDYLQSNTCGSTVAVSATCTISVAFRPKARGIRIASLSVSDNATGSPQTVALSGTGTVVSLSASSINFGNVTVGKTSAPEHANAHQHLTDRAHDLVNRPHRRQPRRLRPDQHLRHRNSRRSNLHHQRNLHPHQERRTQRHGFDYRQRRRQSANCKRHRNRQLRSRQGAPSLSRLFATGWDSTKASLGIRLC